MPTFRLIAKDGTLYFPHGGLDDRWDQRKDEPSLLYRRYYAGDVDTVPWPLASDWADLAELRGRLAVALFDERETNEHFPTDAVIELPDGTPFDFEAELAVYEAAERERRAKEA